MRGLYLTLGLFGLELNWITFPHIVDLLFRRSERKEFRALERHRLEVFRTVMFGTLILLCEIKYYKIKKNQNLVRSDGLHFGYCRHWRKVNLPQNQEMEVSKVL